MSGEDEKSTTFDFGHHAVSDSTFEHIDSSAATLVTAHGGSSANRFSGIRHLPHRADREGMHWTRIGAIAGCAGVVVAVVVALFA